MNDIAPVLGIAVIWGIAAMMLKMWLSHRERISGQPSVRADDGRLERLEQAVESIAIEIERVSEGQRFVTKMLSERASGAPHGDAIQVRSTQ